jgi:hypothetical protein
LEWSTKSLINARNRTLLPLFNAAKAAFCLRRLRLIAAAAAGVTAATAMMIFPIHRFRSSTLRLRQDVARQRQGGGE